MWEHQEGTSIEPFNTNISVQGWVNSLGASCIGLLKAICMKQRSTLCGTKQAERAVGVARAACFEPLAGVYASGAACSKKSLLESCGEFGLKVDTGVPEMVVFDVRPFCWTV